MFQLPADAGVLVRHVEGLDKEAGRVALLLSQWHGLYTLDSKQTVTLREAVKQSEQRVVAHAAWLQQQLAATHGANTDGGILAGQRKLKETSADLKAVKAELLSVKKTHFSLEQHHASTTQQLTAQTSRCKELQAETELLRLENADLEQKILRVEVQGSVGSEDQAEKLFFQIQQLQRRSKAQAARVTELEKLLLEKSQEVESLQQQLSRLVAEVKTNLEKRKTKSSSRGGKRQPLASRTNLPPPIR